MEKLDTHTQVVIEEFSRTCLVSPDSADPCCHVNDDVRTGVGEHPVYGFRLAQVVIPASRYKDLGRRKLLEPPNHKGTEEAIATAQQNALALPEF